MSDITDKPYSLRQRRAQSLSPTTRKENLETNIEYQSEESESEQCDERSFSAEVSAALDSSSGVGKKSRCQKSVSPSCSPRKRETHHTDVAISNERLFENVNCILVIVVLLITVYYFAKVWSSAPVESRDEDSARAHLLAFQNHLTEIASKFENITGDDLRLLFHVGKQWFLMLQKRPVVLIVAGDQSERFVRALTDVFSSSFGIQSPIVDFDLSSESVRSELHGRLERVVHSTVPLAVLDGVDYLGWDAPLALHAFADDSSATHPHTLLFLTVRKGFNKSANECERSVMEYLSSKWIDTGGSMDNVSPILSRIMQFLICL